MRRTIILLLAMILPAAAARGEDGGVLLYDPAAGGTQGWSTPTGRLAAEPGRLRLEIADPVSSFLSPGSLSLDASSIDRIEIDLAVEPAGARAFLYWTDDAEGGFVPSWRVPLSAGRSVLRLAGHPFWRGTIDRFLLAPEPGTKRAALAYFEARGPRGAGERAAEGWRRFWATDLRSAVSVNGILAARAGPFPFPLLAGVLALLAAAILGWPGGRAGRAGAFDPSSTWM